MRIVLWMTALLFNQRQQKKIFISPRAARQGKNDQMSSAESLHNQDMLPMNCRFLSNPVGKALWYIESHFDREITLEDISDASGASRYYLSRAFRAATGHSVIGYVRGRRLTQAARSLADGASDILSVALDCGYASHEAFTRAFRNQFEVTPEAVRARRSLDNVGLVGPVRIDSVLTTDIERPRFENGKTLLIVGLSDQQSSDGCQGIPSQWQRFTPNINHIPGQIGNTCYGVCANFDHTGIFEYIAGVEVATFAATFDGLSSLRIPGRNYAVFSQCGHISTIHGVVHNIWAKWIPELGLEVAEAPDFERYGDEFDPITGMGGFEIWIPLRT
jgi:AraC family transcriptional regulator